MVEPHASPGSSPRRYLLTGIVHTYVNGSMSNLPGLIEDRDRVIGLFVGLGYEYVPAIPDNPTAEQLRNALDQFCRHPDRRPDDYLVVYLGGHGDIATDGPNDHMLLTSDYDQNVFNSSVRITDLAPILLSGTRTHRLLLMVDACYSGQAGLDFVGAAIRYNGEQVDLDAKEGYGVVAVSATRPRQLALQGEFTAGLKRAVDMIMEEGGGSAFRSEDALKRLREDPNKPASQDVFVQVVRGSGYLPAFFGEPERDGVVSERNWAAERARRTAEMANYFMRNISEFVGRAEARKAAVSWLTMQPDKSALVVTGSAGTGKTMLLGWLAAASDAEREGAAPRDRGAAPQVGAIDVAIYARGLALSHILAGIAAAAKLPGIDPDAPPALAVRALLADLATRDGPPLVVLIDALDEALYSKTLVLDLLVPLIRDGGANIRLVLGTRPQVQGFAPELGEQHTMCIDLDKPKFADSKAMIQLVRRRLVARQQDAGGDPRPSVFSSAPQPIINAVVAQISKVAEQSFLLARQLADGQAALDELPDPTAKDWLASVPRDAGRAMRKELHDRLGRDVDRAIDLLRPLAYAQGDGLPWGSIWPAIAEAFAPGIRYQSEDLVWLRNNTASYVFKSDVPGNRPLYRLSHQAIADYLQTGRDQAVDERLVVEALVAAVPFGAEGQRDWAAADPYIRTHLSGHAVRAGSIDSLAQDPGFLIAAESARLLAALDETASPPARAAANAYRRALPALRSQPSEERMAYLGMAARFARADHLADLIPDGPPWRAKWAFWKLQRYNVRVPGFSEPVKAVAVVIGERPIVVSGDDGGVLHLSDAQTGATLREPILAHDDAVTALAASQLDRQPVVVSGSTDGTVRVWDVATGQLIGRPFEHPSAVRAVAVAQVDGDALVVSAGDDARVRVSSLRTGEAAGDPFLRHQAPITALACFEFQWATGREPALTVISADEDGDVWIWELANDQSCKRLPRTRTVHAVAFAEVDQRPVAITGCADTKVYVWDLQTRGLVSKFDGHRQAVHALAPFHLSGQPVVASASDDGSIRVSTLDTGKAVSGTLVGHDKAVRALTAMTFDGRPMVVSGGVDKTVRVWDLGVPDQADPFTGHDLAVMAVVASELHGYPVVISAGRDHTIRVWDLATGSLMRDPITVGPGPGTVAALSPAVVNGAAAVVAAGADRIVRVWDIATGEQIGTAYRGHVAHFGWVMALAVAVLHGRQVAVSAGGDNSVHVWDMVTGANIGRFTGHGGRVRALAVTHLDGKDLVVSGGEDGAVRVWDLNTRNPVGLPFTRHADSVLTLTVAEHEGRPVVISGAENASVCVWDLRTRDLIGLPFTEHTGAIYAIIATRLGGRPVVISGGKDNTARVWRLDDRQTVGHGPIQHTDWVRSVAVSKLDQPVAISGGGDGEITVWDLDTGISRFARHAHWVRSVAVASLGGREQVVSGSVDGAVRVWGLETGRPLAPSVVGQHPGLRSLAVTRLAGGCPVVVTAGDDNIVRTWGLGGDNGVTRVLGQHQDWVRALAITDVRGRRVVVSGGDTTVRLWDLDTGASTGVVYTRHSHWVRAVAVAKLNGRPVVVSASADKTVHVWEAETGRPIGRPFTHSCPVRAVATGVLDGQPFVISAGDDHQVYAWYLESRLPIGEHPFVSRSNEISAVVVAPPVSRGSVAQRRTLRVVVAAGERVDVLRLSADRGWEAEVAVEVRSEVLAAALSSSNSLVIGSKLGLLALDVRSRSGGVQ